MSYNDYIRASKMGQKDYQSKLIAGEIPTLEALDDILHETRNYREVSIGLVQIPLDQIVGTKTSGRSNSFSSNFMPILDVDSEFASKWINLSISQVNEGINSPIIAYEYMNKFYVLEGNKRVSVLKYFKAVTVNAEVIRKVPKYSEDPDVKIYYEFMEFYKCTKLNDIYFSNVGSFPTLMKLVGIKKGENMDEDAKKDFVSCFLSFKNAYDARGGERFDYPAGDAFLRFIHIHGYEHVKDMLPSEMAKNVAKTWAEFELLSENNAVELRMDPTLNEPKKNILSYLLPKPGNGNRKLKVGFIYENTPQDSDWCYTHELGRQYIDDTFGDQIETLSITNVKPDKDDVAAIEMMVKNKADLVFVTSPSMIMASLKEAIAHPEVKILNCSLNTSHKYIRTYYARMYEAKFLTGLIAGALTDNDKIGYVAGYPVYGVTANINAFALGAKFVNPRAKIYLEWSSVKNSNPAEAFKREGIRYVSDQDMITPTSTARRFGLYSIDDETTQHIAMPMWHWGAFYEKMIQSILSGSWNREQDADNVKALNYWWGLSADVVDLIMSTKLPVETQRMVTTFKEMISKDLFEPFADELKDQKGKVRNQKGRDLTPEQIITMDWLLDNVIGKIPELEELEEGCEPIVKAQGIIHHGL